MSQRRSLTPTERAAAEAFAQYAKAAEKRHQDIADEVGVSAAAIGHWLRGEIPIPLRRAGLAARSVGCDPREICPEWAEFVSPYLDRSTGSDQAKAASQPARLDAATIRKAVRLVERTLAALAANDFDPSNEIDSELLALAIEEVTDQRNEEATDAQVLAFVRKASNLGNQRGSLSAIRSHG